MFIFCHPIIMLYFNLKIIGIVRCRDLSHGLPKYTKNQLVKYAPTYYQIQTISIPYLLAFENK